MRAGQTTVDNHLAVVLNLIPKDFQTLGNPPNFNTCTRDTFPEGFVLNMSALLSIVRDIMRAMCIMHDLHVAHGDLYAHNIMFGGSDSETVAATLCDFGASTYYHGMDKSIATSLRELRFCWKFIGRLSSIVQIEDQAEESVLQQLQKYNGNAKIIPFYQGPRWLG